VNLVVQSLFTRRRNKIVDNIFAVFFATIKTLPTFETLLEEKETKQKYWSVKENISESVAKLKITTYLCTPNSGIGLEIGRILKTEKLKVGC
jgi:hypothetical protein